MRAILGVALALAVSATAAAAQVQQNDPNAANASLARQNDIRILNQQRVSDYNTLNMQAQRNVLYRPYQPYHGAYGHVGRRLGAGRTRSGGFNTGVCIGC